MKRLFYLTMALVLLVGIVPVSGISQANVEATTNPTAIFYAADGMRHDLMERYAAEGSMPTYAALMAQGVAGNNGVVQAFPPNTGVGISSWSCARAASQFLEPPGGSRDCPRILIPNGNPAPAKCDWPR